MIYITKKESKYMWKRIRGEKIKNFNSLKQFYKKINDWYCYEVYTSDNYIGPDLKNMLTLIKDYEIDKK